MLFTCQYSYQSSRFGESPTWNNVSRIHCIVILDKPEPIHELNLGDIASSMRFEVFLDILL